MDQLEKEVKAVNPDLESVIQNILEFCRESKTKEAILDFIQVVQVPYSYKKYIKPLVNQRLLENTIAHNPRDTHQQYICTKKALLYLKAISY